MIEHYSRIDLSREEAICNYRPLFCLFESGRFRQVSLYRVSRDRRVVENTFRIIASQSWCMHMQVNSEIGRPYVEANVIIYEVPLDAELDKED